MRTSGSRGSRRLWVGLGLAAIAGAVGLLVVGSLRENVVFFLTPSELHARGPEIYDAPLRLGGQVKPKSVLWDAESRDLRFVIADSAAEVVVHSAGAPPAMFREGMGVVVEGRYRPHGVFESTNLMVKHSNEYKPPHGNETPKEMYRSLIRPEGR
ncbi:MAG: cytochrome c maturation protein CcmE [Gemmatimonadota bacterium]